MVLQPLSSLASWGSLPVVEGPEQLLAAAAFEGSNPRAFAYGTKLLCKPQQQKLQIQGAAPRNQSPLVLPFPACFQSVCLPC